MFKKLLKSFPDFPPWLKRLTLNLYPPFFLLGIKLIYISKAQDEVHVRLKFGWRTRNIVGSMFGGAMSAASDPHYMLILMTKLGIKEYLIWDKSQEIKYLKPAYEHLYIKYKVTEEQLDEIRKTVSETGRCDTVFHAALTNKNGDTVFAEKKYLITVKRKAHLS